jgi:hypothetical protein
MTSHGTRRIAIDIFSALSALQHDSCKMSLETRLRIGDPAVSREASPPPDSKTTGPSAGVDLQMIYEA